MLKSLKNMLTPKRRRSSTLEYFEPSNNVSSGGDPELRFLKAKADYEMLKGLPDEELPLIVNYRWANEGLKEIYAERLRTSRS